MLFADGFVALNGIILTLPEALTAAFGSGVALAAGGGYLYARLRTRTLQRKATLALALTAQDDTARAITGSDGSVLAANAAALQRWPNASPLTYLEHLTQTTAPLTADLDDSDETGPVPETAADALARLLAAVHSGTTEKVELPVQGESGAEWLLVETRPTDGGDGAAGRLWTATDISARRIIDDILRQERDDLAEFLYLLPVGVYSADSGGRLRSVNQRFSEWLGYTPKDLTGQPLSALLNDGEVPDIEGAWRGELSFVDSHGRPFPALVFQTTYDDGGETLTRSVVVREALSPAQSAPAEDHRYRSLFDNAPVGLCVLDPDGVITDCNTAFEALCGHSRADLIDGTLTDLLTEEDRADGQELFDKTLMEQGPPAQREVRFAANPDNAAMLRFHLLEGDAVVAYLIDTTAQRNLEAQFAQAQKMQAMGQLAGGVAHDFNNLLTAMIGYCDLLLQRHGAGDPSFADIMQVKQNANRAANLVRQLLAFSRKQPLKPRRLTVTDALSELSHLLRRLLGESVRLDLRHGRDVGNVRVDPGQFDQVIINLAVNARDAMSGGGCLTISTRQEQLETPLERGAEVIPPGPYAVITVTDTGVGIPRENLGRIFEPFFSTKTGSIGAGTGLGLSTVYGIIRQTGGFIFVDSRLNDGTTFTIYLPRLDDMADASEPVVRATDDPVLTAALVPPPSDSADLTGGGTILLVEDEDPVRVFAARALRNKGYTVTEARTGEQALDLLAENPAIDLLITDMVMPGIDGATLARTVRADRPGLQVILISGYSEEAARGEIADSTDFHFLPKPFSLTQLAARVKALLAQNGSGGSGGSSGGEG
ncbi:PAS domain-containing protein [Novispirillum itersonii]|uniref:PAS domain-containing protein n=1 Tax=Novispirillum itersonii TaxID=189 RepID=UPI000381BB06|nr:PAS domain-containing protein [Novispirillum itersonii]